MRIVPSCGRGSLLLKAGAWNQSDFWVTVKSGGVERELTSLSAHSWPCRQFGVCPKWTRDGRGPGHRRLWRRYVVAATASRSRTQKSGGTVGASAFLRNDGNPLAELAGYRRSPTLSRHQATLTCASCAPNSVALSRPLLASSVNGPPNFPVWNGALSLTMRQPRVTTKVWPPKLR